uniref:Uncharacterized protein n=1 Tax=Alexandrium andersonii TaxID=327968 RepID=A0A7S2I910_9DINO|mmetsp:Transcript_80431/g.179955  ORF Transcript_80431/g.179955 Transcript_80431/m.179955 type:complete len:189 (+) Transcript_80431:63-629(+)
MSGKLPKLQLPGDEEARRRITEATDLARAGEMKAAQQALREAASSQLIAAPLQRQILAWWSAGCYDLPGLGGNESAQGDAIVRGSPASTPPAPRRSEADDAITRVMREHNWSHKEAAKYVEEGGLEMEAMKAEMDHPMDAAFQKLKEQGPPQWFIDMWKEHEAKEAVDAGAPAAVGDAVALAPAAAVA